MDIKKFEDDIDKLAEEGQYLFWAMYLAEYPQEKEKHDKEAIKKLEKNLPDFSATYQTWYSEALECVKQLLPSRAEDFISYYSPTKSRKHVAYENYTVRDYLDRLTRHVGSQKIVGTDAAVTKFQQQLEIVKALKRRFKSSLFDIQTLVEADVFEDELDAATELNKKGFGRAAGAVAGVVLEGHLGAVCDRHSVKISKKNPSISDFNDALKNAGVIEVAVWRKIQFLGDIRNKCDHKKTIDPTKDEIDELIEGVRKYIRTLF